MTPILNAVRRMRGFAHEHDDIPAFHAAYLVGTFLAAALFNLGFFVILIVGHMCLDYVKYRDINKFSFGLTVKAMFRESMIDIALLLVAMVFIVYLNNSFAIAAMSGMARAELTILRALGTIAPKIEIIERLFGIVMNIEQYLHGIALDPSRPLRAAEKWAVFATGVSICLLALAFALFQGHEGQILQILAKEFSLAL